MPKSHRPQLSLRPDFLRLRPRVPEVLPEPNRRSVLPLEADRAVLVLSVLHSQRETEGFLGFFVFWHPGGDPEA